MKIFLSVNLFQKYFVEKNFSHQDDSSFMILPGKKKAEKQPFFLEKEHFTDKSLSTINLLLICTIQDAKQSYTVAEEVQFIRSVYFLYSITCKNML